MRIGFTSLHENKKGFTGKLLLGGFCLTGLIGGRRTADDQTAKYEGKSERLHSILPGLGRRSNPYTCNAYLPASNQLKSKEELTDWFAFKEVGSQLEGKVKASGYTH